MGTGSFLGVKCGRGVLLTTHPLLVPQSWKSRAIPLPTLWATPGLLEDHFIFILLSLYNKYRKYRCSITPIIDVKPLNIFYFLHYLIQSLCSLFPFSLSSSCSFLSPSPYHHPPPPLCHIVRICRAHVDHSQCVHHPDVTNFKTNSRPWWPFSKVDLQNQMSEWR